MVQFGDQIKVDGIAFFGAGEGDQRDGINVFDGNQLVRTGFGSLGGHVQKAHKKRGINSNYL
ncbi:hypothetical protein [Neopusillimonas aromaticivorans]|uniref:hypothetical protein n=1 Tax=Neopusillimonas aromaticivorans TaxID=2979868 RepID=UPI00259A2C7A|nr:hypothetical protein [Neopusillimonas aromaticivorans]WJJ95126.1 hypothetical protein N7E01_08485 [Neopusillimonas aromaticivorans]